MSRLHLCAQLALGLTVGPAWTADDPPCPTDAFGDPLPDGAVARLGTLRWRTLDLPDFTFSHDGRYLTSGARFWDLADGREGRRLPGVGGYAIALSPDDKSVAGICQDKSEDVLRLWDAVTGKVLREIGGPVGLGRFDQLVFSADGKKVLLPGGDSIRSFDAATGEATLLRGPLEKGARARDVSKDGAAAIFGGPDGRLIVWDLATAQALGEVSGCGGEGPVALSPDHRRLAAAWKEDRPVIQLWDLETGKKLGRCRGDGPAEFWSLDFSPDGKSLASGDWGVLAQLWDAETGKERWRFCPKFASRAAVRVRFTPDGKTVAAIGWGDSVHLIDAGGGKERGDPDAHRTWITAAAFTADGKQVVMGDGDGSIRLWDAETGKEVRRLRVAATGSSASNPRDVSAPVDTVRALACATDGKTLAVGTETGAALWDTSAVREPRLLRSTGQTTALAFAPDGKRLATWDGFLHLWDVASGERSTLRSEYPDSADVICWSPDGRLVAASCRRGFIRVWDVAEGREVHTFGGGGGGWAPPLVFSPDGKTLVCTGAGQIQVLELVSGKKREWWDHGGAGITHFAITPGGRLLAGGGDDGIIRIYDLNIGKEIHQFHGHDRPVTSLAISPDGARLVSGSEDCTALVWEMTAVRPADPLKEPDLSDRDRDGLWDRLATRDPRDAGRAIRDLLAAPRQAVALLRERLRPEEAPTAEQIARLVRDLDADEFDAREQASSRLRALGETAAPALRKGLEGNPSAELRQRIQSPLAALARGEPSSERLRASRAVEVLERIGTTEARAVLKTLAGGSEEAPLTRDAAAALDLLSRRPGGAAGAP